MPKEILLYTSIYSYSAAAFINEMEANKNSAICVRGNCPGGDMFSTYGMIAKFQEHKAGKEIQVDGIAASAFAYMLCFADKVECLDVSTILFHRASFGDPELEKTMDEADKKILAAVNASIRSALELKIPAAKFLEVTGVSYDEMFSMDQRLDVIINAEQAKALGLVTTINKLTASKKSEIMALSNTYGIAAFSKEPIIQSENTNAMTVAEFKKANPEAYQEIFDLGHTAGISAEQTRTKTWLAYKDIDAEAVAKGISEGKAVDPVIMAEMQIKAISKNKIEAIAGDNPPPVKTAEEQAAATAEAKQTETFLAEVKANRKNFKN
jgi:ATP-dependent protease ClpP protease subunit